MRSRRSTQRKRTRAARIRRDPSLRFLGVCLVSAALLAGLALLVRSASSDPVVAAVEHSVPAEVTCPDADGDTGLLRACLDGVIVRVVTPYGHGSGVVLESGEIVTNAHVVDRHNSVTVEFVDGRTVEDVAVLGMDVVDDIALLEPIEDLDDGVELAAVRRESGQSESTVFLVGFPGDSIDEAPQLTITEGVLSRLRRSERFDHTILQSDATIFGGQSGGALVDRSGRVLGISGSGIGPDVSFSLSTADVMQAIDRIRTDESMNVAQVPGTDDLESGALSFELAGGDEATRVVWIPGADAARTIRLAITEGSGVRFSAWTSDAQLAINRAWSRWELRYYGDPSEFGDVGAFDDTEDEVSEWYELESPWIEPEIVAPTDGVYEIEQPAGTTLALELGSPRRQDVAIDIDVPRLLIEDAAEGRPISIGETAVGAVDPLARRTMHEIELTADDEIAVRLRTPGASAEIRLLTPDPDIEAGYPGIWYTDFGAISWQEYDISQTYTIRRAGTFLIEVSSAYPTAYELSVVAAD